MKKLRRYRLYIFCFMENGNLKLNVEPSVFASTQRLTSILPSTNTTESSVTNTHSPKGGKANPWPSAAMASSLVVSLLFLLFLLGFQDVYNNHGMVSEAKLMTEHSASTAFTLKVLYWYVVN